MELRQCINCYSRTVFYLVRIEEQKVVFVGSKHVNGVVIWVAWEKSIVLRKLEQVMKLRGKVLIFHCFCVSKLQRDQHQQTLTFVDLSLNTIKEDVALPTHYKLQIKQFFLIPLKDILKRKTDSIWPYPLTSLQGSLSTQVMYAESGALPVLKLLKKVDVFEHQSIVAINLLHIKFISEQMALESLGDQHLSASVHAAPPCVWSDIRGSFDRCQKHLPVRKVNKTFDLVNELCDLVFYIYGSIVFFV